MIREARLTDAKAVGPLILVILKDMELPILDIMSEATLLELLEQAYQEPSYRYGYKRGFVEEVDGQIAGVVFGYPSEAESTIDLPMQQLLAERGFGPNQKLFEDPETLPGEWYLDSISVAEEFRGQGIGAKLMAALPEIAAAAGEQTIGLNVDVVNDKARRLYERQGFQPVGSMMISGHRYDHMQKGVKVYEVVKSHH